jgi:adenosylcobinamide-GDP ribazoletransferase
VTSFFAALEFLTVLRVRPRSTIGLRDVAHGVAWFPAVGLLIGALLLAFDRAASRALPPGSVDVLLVVALVLLTGALHLDGLADAADGLFGGGDPGQRLEIMRDVHAGTYAIVAVASILALKWAGLAALPSQVRFEALLLTPCIARSAAVVAIAAFSYVRPAGLGVEFKEAALPWRAPAGMVSALVASILLLGAGGIYAAAFAVIVALAFGALATRLVGGMTGDLYGATIEITEAAVLLFIAALAQRGWIDAFAFGS